MNHLPPENERTPQAAVVLGAAGTLPLIGLTPVAFWTTEPFGVPVTAVAVAYSAVILSFLGGMHWGLASAALAREPGKLDAPAVLGFSVLPSIVGWIALLLPVPASPIVLAFSFTAVLLLDRWTARLQLAPGWWMRLRFRLTAVVVPLLLLLALAPRE